MEQGSGGGLPVGDKSGDAASQSTSSSSASSSTVAMSYADSPEFTGSNAMVEEVTRRLTLGEDGEV